MNNLSLTSRLKKTIVLTAISFAVVGCSYNHSNTSYSPILKQQTNIGAVLTDDSHMTLYTFDKDKSYISNCNNDCAIKWPPLLANNNGIANERFSVITRSDNSKQWALDGKPLYRWFKDKKPGDTTGNGIKSVWHIARP